MTPERTAEVRSSGLTPAENAGYFSHLVERLPSASFAKERVMPGILIGAVAATIGLITLFMHGYRLSMAPDVFGDEGYYLQIGMNLARGGGLVGPDNAVYFAEPPAYLLIEAAYIKVAGLSNADPLITLFSVRYLNVFFSAATASLLFLFGRKLKGYKPGLIMATLFLLDPYVQRINRRGMLETLAMLCSLLGLYLFFTHRPHLTMPRRLGSGIAFGLAILTKEPMALELCVLIGYAIFCRRRQLHDAVWIVAIACAVYLPYPVWAVAAGQGARFISVKWFQLSRIPQSIANLLPSIPRPPYTTSAQAHTLQNFLTLLPRYGTSYLLIAFGAVFTAVLIFRFRYLFAARYLITWSLFSFGVGASVALVSDQYFYYLIVPCAVLCGYVPMLLLDTGQSSFSRRSMVAVVGRHVAGRWAAIDSKTVRAFVVAIFFVMALYNGYAWRRDYMIGSDDAYIAAIRYITTHIPTGETIVIGDDTGIGAFLPAYNVRQDRDTRQILAQGERYFVMSSKAVGYQATPQFYAWVVRNSRALFVQDDQSYLKVGVYVLRAPTAVTPTGVGPDAFGKPLRYGSLPRIH